MNAKMKKHRRNSLLGFKFMRRDGVSPSPTQGLFKGEGMSVNPNADMQWTHGLYCSQSPWLSALAYSPHLFTGKRLKGMAPGWPFQCLSRVPFQHTQQVGQTHRGSMGSNRNLSWTIRLFRIACAERPTLESKKGGLCDSIRS